MGEMMKEEKTVSYAEFESVQVRHERTVKRFIIAFIILAILFFANNAIWLYAWCQYDYTSSESTETVNVDGKDGVANYIGNDGDINNGESNGKKDNANENTP